MHQAEELNTLIGNAFRLAYAMQLKEDRATGNTTTLYRFNDAAAAMNTTQNRSFSSKTVNRNSEAQTQQGSNSVLS